ncbi:polysaccharide biosynthesis/export family protein [Flavitalea sp.]|nr:polysaccharide biosynthesis/export family protein [Flavitalea sp.]
MNTRHLLYLLIISSVVLPSCFNTKDVTSFNSIKDTTIQYSIESLEPVIQKNDILSISVSSLNTDATQPFNLYTISSSQGAVNSGTVSQASGFLVNQEGYIQFPMLGSIKVAGMTKKTLTDTITAGLIKKNLLYEPIVNIRYLNYKITVLGEVARPAVINVPGEKITLLEALGVAGDLTSYANRTNILVIRDSESGTRTTKRLDLTDDDLFTSPYYFLKSNDIIYVAPNKAKAAGTSTSRQWWPVVLSAMSFVAIVIGIIADK